MTENYKIGIIGLGYVGLPLAVEFAGKGYDVLGFDIKEKRIKALQNHNDETDEITKEELQQVNNLTFSSDETLLKDRNIYIVTVPTPVDDFKQPDLAPLIAASTTVGKHLTKGDIVIYESTTYPGCTEEDCVPVLDKVSGLAFNQDFFCGSLPEQITTEDKKRQVRNIERVSAVSAGVTAEIIDALNNAIFIVVTKKAASDKVEETSKIKANVIRDLNTTLKNG